MYVKLLEVFNNWQQIKNTTMTTIHKEKGKYPDSLWKRQILLSEHSPIRKLKFSWKWYDLKSWVSVHLVRHKFGIDHFVRTQRTDRTSINRDELPQGNLVEHECEANAQAIINISRKRLCSQASKETREAWQEFLNSIKDIEPELYKCCVPECIYRGHCFEFQSCGYHKTEAFKKKLEEYRNGINKKEE
jgi:hypothetical protein